MLERLRQFTSKDRNKGSGTTLLNIAWETVQLNHPGSTMVERGIFHKDHVFCDFINADGSYGRVHIRGDALVQEVSWTSYEKNT